MKRIYQLGSVRIGDRFVFRAAEIFPNCETDLSGREGKTMTVVAFYPRYVNQVFVTDFNGVDQLMPLRNVQKAIDGSVVDVVSDTRSLRRPAAPGNGDSNGGSLVLTRE